MSGEGYERHGNASTPPPPPILRMISECGSAAQAFDEFVAHYHKMSMLEIKAGRTTYNETFKFHLGWHIVDQCRFENSMKCGEYMWEDLMGKMSRIGWACTAGLSSQRISFKILLKYKIAAAVFLGSDD